MIRLHSGAAEAVIDPDLGAGIVALKAAGLPVLSAGLGRPQGSAFAQGLNLLAPFSNRISRPFAFEGRTHPVPATLPGEPFPIHGDAFQKPWTIEAQSDSDAALTLRGAIGPFRYDACVAYVLRGDALSVRLDLTNRADVTLPYGGGFHPWFPRHASTRLEFRAKGAWPEDDRHLPATPVPTEIPADVQFETAAPLPPGWINCGFSGWDGIARIIQPGLAITVEAPGLTTALVYSPGAAAPFFCFEPVSHPVDAHNLPGQPGLVPLASGTSLSMSLRLSWQPVAPKPPVKETRS